VSSSDRLTAATSPVAAFAGLAIGLLVLKMTRQQARYETIGSEADQPGQSATPERLQAVAGVPALLPGGSPGAVRYRPNACRSRRQEPLLPGLATAGRRAPP
jgi:hypothetical protein